MSDETPDLPPLAAREDGTKDDATEAIRKETQGGRLGGARADFVASLGRKVDACRPILKALEADPGGRAHRDDLRRKLHALGAGARLLRFEALSNALGEAESILERVASGGRAGADDLAALARVLDDLPSLAWADPSARMVSPSEPPAATAPAPHTALVIGPEELAGLIAEGSTDGGLAFACERTGDEQVAFELARSILPELIVLDGDLSSAMELVEALQDDPVTEPIPIVVVAKTGDEGRFVALGVARVVRHEAVTELHAACAEVVGRKGKPARLALGDLTVAELGDRLAAEVRRALVDEVDEAMRKERVPLGEGSEILGAIWGAISRIREVVAARTDGAVRFAPSGPEGALTLAPWLHPEVPQADRERTTRGAAAEVDLTGRKVIVADDDPGVTWFISDLLRTNGCIVHEALDGQTALDLAYRIAPDLVVSDILMPGLDGFALSRAIKRDVALRDVPIILLSWKEDLLQRVRELGVSAAAYLRKESDARAIVARVREALWTKARVEARLKPGGEVRGRLDGLTVRTLLELVCAIRPSSRLSVRDACFLYEMEIREGTPRRVTRTGGDGSFERGERVLAQMLGASAGWFVVAPAEGALQGELHGTLAAQLARPIAAARGAALAVCGARTISVEKVTLDLGMMEGYLRVTPGPARTLIEALSAGESPREMLLAGEVDPWLLEDVLVDLAVRGTVRGVRGILGDELLGPAVESAHAVLQGMPRRASLAPKAPSVGPRASAAPAPGGGGAGAGGAGAAGVRSSRVPLPPQRAFVDEEDALPSSLADAVMRELREPSSKPPPIVEPRALRPRSSAPASSETTDVLVASTTELDTVYEARMLTPSSPNADTAMAVPASSPGTPMPEPSVSLPLPLVQRSEKPRGGSSDGS